MRTFPTIIKWPDERLHTKCNDITNFNKDQLLQELVDGMLEIMRDEQGVGLAAIQVGISVNLLVVELEPNNPLVFINPKIILASEDMFEWNEGCLSVPGYFEKRKRPKRITVQYNTIDGTERTQEFHGLYAFVIQHEMDHLNGKVFVDGFSKFKESRVKERMKKFKKKR